MFKIRNGLEFRILDLDIVSDFVLRISNLFYSSHSIQGIVFSKLRMAGICNNT